MNVNKIFKSVDNVNYANTMKLDSVKKEVGTISVNGDRTVEIGCLKGKIIGVVNVLESERVDVEFQYIIDGLIDSRKQLFVESVYIREDNSIDIYLKDGNVLTILDVERILSNAVEFIDIRDLDDSFTIRALERSNIIVNGKVVNLNYQTNILDKLLIAIDRRSDSIALCVPRFGFVCFKNSVLKEVLAYLPYAGFYHQRDKSFVKLTRGTSYWKILVAVILIVIVVIYVLH